MARTHGTRSSYNTGCRCAAYREASRLAHPRQREADRWKARLSSDEAVAPFEAIGVPWLTVGVVGFGTGGFTLWKGVTFESNEDVDEDTGRHTRRRWILAGVGLLVFGLFALRGWSDPTDSEYLPEPQLMCSIKILVTVIECLVLILPEMATHFSVT